MQKVYFISGVGADERAFQLLDLSFCIPIFVKWINPVEGEDITSYASRLIAQIDDPKPVIVGLSFGGMIAIEIAKQILCQKIILISSSKSQREIPFYLRSLRYLPVHKYVKPRFLRTVNQFAYKVMGIANRRDKQLFSRMFRQADDCFVQWAINAIIHWKNDVIPEHTFHIHGTRDILLPYRFIRQKFAVAGGGHLMLLSRPAEISGILREMITRPVETWK